MTVNAHNMKKIRFEWVNGVVGGEIEIIEDENGLIILDDAYSPVPTEIIVGQAERPQTDPSR